MTMPTAEELDRIRARAIERKMDDLVKGPRGYSFGNAGVKVMNEAGCIAIRDAVIEALAQECEAPMVTTRDMISWETAWRTTAVWLRKHLEATDADR